MVTGELVVEIVVLVLYIVTFYLAYKIKKLDFLVYASVFAFIFENLNVLFFSGGASGYFYSNNFSVYLFHVPLFIILAWGILFLGAYLVALKLRMSKISRVFFVPVFFCLVDFVIEGVSVNLGYWVWLGVEGGGGLFSSIAVSNFIGWLGVGLGFILCYEYLERKWMSMFLGYFVFLALSFVAKSIDWVFDFSGNEEYIILGIVLFVFVGLWVYFYHKNIILNKNKKELQLNFEYAKYVVYMRVFFYLFALFWFFWNSYYLDPVYDVVLGLVIAIEIYFFLRFRGVLKKRI